MQNNDKNDSKGSSKNTIKAVCINHDDPKEIIDGVEIPKSWIQSITNIYIRPSEINEYLNHGDGGEVYNIYVSVRDMEPFTIFKVEYGDGEDYYMTTPHILNEKKLCINLSGNYGPSTRFFSDEVEYQVYYADIAIHKNPVSTNEEYIYLNKNINQTFEEYLISKLNKLKEISASDINKRKILLNKIKLIVNKELDEVLNESMG